MRWSVGGQILFFVDWSRFDWLDLDLCDGNSTTWSSATFLVTQHVY